MIYKAHVTFSKVILYILTSCVLVRTRNIPTYDRRWSANFSADFCGEKVVAWSARRFPKAVNLCIRHRSRYSFFQVDTHLSSGGSVDLFQTNCYSENVVAPGIESGTSGSAARNSKHAVYICVCGVCVCVCARARAFELNQ
jgi:hypothetical protein